MKVRKKEAFRRIWKPRPKIIEPKRIDTFYNQINRQSRTSLGFWRLLRKANFSKYHIPCGFGVWFKKRALSNPWSKSSNRPNRWIIKGFRGNKKTGLLKYWREVRFSTQCRTRTDTISHWCLRPARLPIPPTGHSLDICIL